MAIKNSKGFTLVEMLVVIAIISVLAAALFPAIQNALGTAQATALKNKGRGIWVAINSANLEREPLNLGTLWPKDLTDDDDITFEESAVGYFKYLLSDGGDEAAVPDDQEVADLTCSSLIASGVPPATKGSSLADKNIAWAVCKIGNSDASEYPFLISKNVGSAITEFKGGVNKGSPNKIDISSTTITKPFGKTRAVWVTRGGGCFDARAKYLSEYQILGECDSLAESIEVWTCSE